MEKLIEWLKSICPTEWFGGAKSLQVKDLFNKKVLLSSLGVATVLGTSYTIYAWFSGEQESYLSFYLPLLAPEYKIEGFVDDGFEKVREAFIKTYKDKWEQTSQLSVFYKGKEVVNLYGMIDGFKTDDRSLTMMFSSGKTTESLVIMLLVQRGLLKFDTKISTFWPEFGKNDKEEITVSEVLNHTSGLGIQPVTLTIEHLSDPNVLSEMIEGMTPKHRGKMFYHGHMRGLIIGEIVRRVDPQHRRINEFIKQELSDPLKLQYYVGNMPESEFPNVLPLNAFTVPQIAKLIVKSVLQLTLPVSVGGYPPKILKGLMQMTDPKSDVARMLNDHSYMTDETLLRTKIVNTSNCSYSNARSMAKLGSLVGNGEIDGIKIFTPEVIEEAISGEVEREDMFSNMDWKFTKAGFTNLGNTYGWTGTGGSVLRFNIKHKVGIGFLPTGMQMSVKNRYDAIEDVIFECIERLEMSK